jgi:ribokinase
VSADVRPVRGKRLVCVGNLAVDQRVENGFVHPPELGGDAAYAAVAARLHLQDVQMIAPVGTDVDQELLSSLRQLGLIPEPLLQRAAPTVRNQVEYHPDGSRTWSMLSDPSDFDLMSVRPQDLPASSLDADGILVCGMSLDSQVELMPWLRCNSQATIYLDLQEDYLDGNIEALLGLVGYCDVFLPSEVEAAALTDGSDMRHAAARFHDRGAKVVVIKMAEKGCLVFAGSRTEIIAARQVPVADSTGAGDAFCGAFAAAHLVCGDPRAAALEATRTAALSVTGAGLTALLGAAQSLEVA